MRIRALLFIPALAAAALAIGVSSASAATLFTTNAHTARVTIGATVTATSEGNVDLTAPAAGMLANRCTDISLNLRVVENSVHRSSLDVYSSVVGTCHPNAVTTTHVPPWRLTITGSGTMVGASTAFAGTLHNTQFDVATIAGPFVGNLENLTVTQGTTTTNGICVDANGAGPTINSVSGGIPGFIDARFCLTNANQGGAAWSLT